MTDIPSYKGLYSITEDGMVYSHKKTNKYKKSHIGMWLKVTNDRGYGYVSLHKEGEQKKVAVHRLMAITFLGIDQHRNHVNHKDGNKLNNKIENLEWCTPKENCVHAWKNNLSKVSDKMRFLSSNKMNKWVNSKEGALFCSKNGKARRKLSIDDIKNILKFKEDGESAYAVSKRYPVSKQTILKIYRGETYKEILDELQ